MPTVTLGDIRARVRSMADMEGSSFIQDSKYSLDAYINSAARTMYDIVAGYADAYAKRVSIQVSKDVEEVPLPSDFRLLVGVEYKDEPIQQYGFSQPGQRYACRPGYRLESGLVLRISPPPDSDGPHVRVYYMPAAPTLAAETDTLEVFEPGWEDFIVYDACMMASQKEERDTTFMASRRNEMAQRIQSLAATRSLTGTNQVADVVGGILDYGVSDYGFHNGWRY